MREERDYAYHVNYTKERQLWQDKVIKRVVSRTEPQPHPWIVYTCGPAGAGKGFALSWMSQHGYFPLENICHIDPDQFKHAMPEWKSCAAPPPPARTSSTSVVPTSLSTSVLTTSTTSVVPTPLSLSALPGTSAGASRRPRSCCTESRGTCRRSLRRWHDLPRSPTPPTPP